jgi:hypothetical protein
MASLRFVGSKFASRIGIPNKFIRPPRLAQTYHDPTWVRAFTHNSAQSFGVNTQFSTEFTWAAPTVVKCPDVGKISRK